MHLLVFGRGYEAPRGLGLINRAIAMDFCAARLRLGLRPQRFRGALGMIETSTSAVDGVAIIAGQKLRMQHALRITHALAPLRIWAIWMNFIGTPMRSAQPFWCIRHELSAETTYSAPARA